MQIICSGGKIYTILNNLDRESTVILNLVSVYYVSDIVYPAVYGFLSVLGQIVFDLKQQRESLSGEKGRKIRKKKGPVASSALRKFLTEFEKFKKRKEKEFS